MASQKGPPQLFQPNPSMELVIQNLSGELNTYDADIDIADNQLSGGQNMTRIGASDSSLKKRGGIQLFGNFIGTTTGILGGYNALSSSGSQEILCTYDTQMLRYVSGTWIALTGVTLTTNLPGDFSYFQATDKHYYLNGTNNVVKYQNGNSSADQTDSSFKKGKYIANWKGRLMVSGIAATPDLIWYTDVDVDTFSASNWFRVQGAVTGMKVIQDKMFIFTKTQVFVIYNYTFDGTATEPSQLTPLPTSFGAIYERTIHVVNNQCYFLGQDTNYKAAIYMVDFWQLQAVPLSDTKISSTMKTLNSSQLANSCAVRDGFLYRLYVPTASNTTNDSGIIFDTNRQYFYPVETRWTQKLADMSVMWSSEIGGQWYVFGGSSLTGQIYQFNANDGLYDELPEQRYLTAGSYNVPINANPAVRAAQSFQMTGYQNTQTVNLTQAAVYLKKNSGTTTNLSVSIQTDNNGKPSGTNVTNGTATIAAFTLTSYAWYQISFSGVVTLKGSTTYWLVIQHTTEGTGNSDYFWLGNTCTSSYVPGNLATYTTTITTTTNTYNPSSSAPSGYVQGYSGSNTGESFSALRSGAQYSGTQSSINADISSGSSSNSFFILNRGNIFFDTSSIPDNAIINTAVISLYSTFGQDGLGQTLNITSFTGSIMAYDISNYGSTRFTTDKNILNDLTLNTYNNFSLNSNGINNISLTGISKFALRLSGDIDNIAPTWQASISTQAQFQSYTSANPPQLIINYSVPGGTPSWTPDPITDQLFALYDQAPIDGYFDTKANLSNTGKQLQIERFQVIFNTAATYNVQVSFSDGSFSGQTIYSVPLTNPTGGLWDDGISRWDSGLTWDAGISRKYDTWTEINGYLGRVIKMRVRNNQANQQFEFNQATIEFSPRLSHT